MTISSWKNYNHLLNTNETIVEYDKQLNQYNSGYRYIWSEQFGVNLVFKSEVGAPFGSGLYELTDTNEQGKCVIWNYDSSD